MAVGCAQKDIPAARLIALLSRRCGWRHQTHGQRRCLGWRSIGELHGDDWLFLGYCDYCCDREVDLRMVAWLVVVAIGDNYW